MLMEVLSKQELQLVLVPCVELELVALGEAEQALVPYNRQLSVVLHLSSAYSQGGKDVMTHYTPTHETQTSKEVSMPQDKKLNTKQYTFFRQTYTFNRSVRTIGEESKLFQIC